MFWLIFSIVVTLVLFIALGFEKGGKWRVRSRHILAILGLSLLIPGFISKVPANSVGIKFSPFTGTSTTTLSEGFHSKGLFDRVYNISTEVQTLTIEGLTTQTEDAQFVTTVLDVKYRVNTSNAYLVFTQYRTLDNMSNTLIKPTTQRVLELITTRYNVMDILGSKRGDIYAELEMALQKEFAKYGVEFYSISITDMDAGAEIEAAITAEAVAKKAVETAEQELLKAQTEAKQAAVIAQAEQEAAKISAETEVIKAEAQKKANELLQQSLTKELLQKLWIEKWNGELPMYSGDSNGLIFDINP
ncbi:MAG: hypothetical protein IKL73_08690 [Lachnospiraceae bacterium]|nr:hypothetical protein [Lachnospiraceae bacterium]